METEWSRGSLKVKASTPPTDEQRIHAYYLQVKPKIVTLCGSMRFYAWMLEVAERETISGSIVLSPHVRKRDIMTDEQSEFYHTTEQHLPDGVNMPIVLDAMHRHKIDMSSEVIICSDNARYMGESTKAEVLYAIQQGKLVRWACDPVTPLPGEDAEDYK